MKAGKDQFHEIPSLPNTQLASSQWVIPLQASGHQGVGSNPGWDGPILLSTSQTDQLTPDFQTWNTSIVNQILKSVHVAKGFMKVLLMIALSPTG